MNIQTERAYKLLEKEKGISGYIREGHRKHAHRKPVSEILL